MSEAPSAAQPSGILNINKPAGLTSHDVVARIRKITGQRKAGHTGTLDPMATGVLLVCLGQATRLIEFMMAGQKQYRATMTFGVETDTLDAEGQTVRQTDASALTPDQLKNLLPQFKGEILQRPPIFSAIKQQGQPLYKRARAGEAVKVDPRPVIIYDLAWLAWQPPHLTLAVTCSAGTYIRSLARDLGQAAGVGAHLSALERTANGGWSVEQAVSLDELDELDALEALTGNGWRQHLQPPEQGVEHLPRVDLSAVDAEHIRHGRPVQLPASANPPHSPPLLRAHTADGRFLAILKPADVTEDNQSAGQTWRPKKVFNL